MDWNLLKSGDINTAALIVIVSVILIYLLWTRRKFPPGPIGLPLVGYLPFITRNPHIKFQELKKKYGPVFSLRIGTKYVVVLNDYQSIRAAFLQDAFIGRPSDIGFELSKETTETLAFNGPPWKEQRRFMLNLLKDLGFYRARMENFIQEEIHELIERLTQEMDKPFDMSKLLAPSMSNNVSCLVFGKRRQFDDPKRVMLDKILRRTGQSVAQVAWQAFFPWLKAILKFIGLGMHKELSKTLHKMKDYAKEEIAEHEKTLDPNNIRDFIDGYLLEIEKKKKESDTTFLMSAARAFLEMVTAEYDCRTDEKPKFEDIQLAKLLFVKFCKILENYIFHDEEEFLSMEAEPVLVDLCGALFGAGSETVRVSLDWLLLVAAAFPDVQKKIQAEIDDVIGRGRLPSKSDAKNMPYTEAVITELLRWRSIIPINVLRYTIEDTKLNSYFIPKHAYVVANLWGVLHDPDLWGNDAEEFKPERFLSKDGKEVSKPDYYIPFSTGKRQCPGEPLALVEVFLYYTSLLQKFSISLPDGATPDFEGKIGLSLQPKAYKVCLKFR